MFPSGFTTKSGISYGNVDASILAPSHSFGDQSPAVEVLPTRNDVRKARLMMSSVGLMTQ